MSPLRSTLEQGILIYRRTLKRSRHLHSALYTITRVILVPIMEKTTGFYTMNDSPLSYRIGLITGSYEGETVKLVEQLVKPGMTVLDIGANVGYYTKPCSKIVGDAGCVIAFEPHPLAFGVLCKNVRALRNVTPVQAAVTDQEGTVNLYDYLLGAENASLRYDENKRDWYRSHLPDREMIPRIREDLPIAIYTVKATTLDTYLAEARVERVDFIKMDIEGAEINAIRGMKRTVQSSPRLSLMMEFNPHAMQLFGVDPAEALEELREIGFSRAMVIEDNGRLTEVENNDMATQLANGLMERMARVNLLCVKEA
jgi:FkbM family methyltransferase